MTRQITFRGPGPLLVLAATAAAEWAAVPVLWGAGWVPLAIILAGLSTVRTAAVAAVLTIAANQALTRRRNPWK